MTEIDYIMLNGDLSEVVAFDDVIQSDHRLIRSSFDLQTLEVGHNFEQKKT